MTMVTAYTTALPPAGLPAMESVIAAVGTSLLFAILLALLAVFVGVLVQGSLARPVRRRAPLRAVEPPRHAAPASRAA
jgi:hypothetical protein